MAFPSDVPDGRAAAARAAAALVFGGDGGGIGGGGGGGGGGTACSSSDVPDGGREGDGAGLIPARRRLRVIPALRSLIALEWFVAQALRVLRMGSWKGKRPELLYCKLAAAAIPKKVVHG